MKAHRGASHVRRRIAHWRRLTTALQVLVNTGSGGDELAVEAHTLRRQCELLAAALADLVHGRHGLQRSSDVAAPRCRPMGTPVRDR